MKKVIQKCILTFLPHKGYKYPLNIIEVSGLLFILSLEKWISPTFLHVEKNEDKLLIYIFLVGRIQISPSFLPLGRTMDWIGILFTWLKKKRFTITFIEGRRLVSFASIVDSNLASPSFFPTLGRTMAWLRLLLTL